ncbi:MAG: GNAT family N-acetyltransferase [Candidatus Competibacteraceae bacterium]|nr:GNAT family N-acetyltransferase [Candidatus Competibacteraceae bacterium]
MIKQAITDQDIEDCFDVMVELRPHLERDEFLATVRSMEKEGYKLALIKANDEVVAVAGYRLYTNLFMGKNLYIDDLVTSDKFRSKGFGAELLHWLREEATRSGCNFYHLDSGTHRGKAHKFYFQHGFTIASYHFSEKLTES